MEKTLLFFMFFFFMKGVFGETHEKVKEGGTVTLHTGLTEIQKDDVMDWMFKAEAKNILIARVEYNSKPLTYNVLNGTFNGRLQLNGQTGDLTITNIKKTDSGVYEVSNSINTIRKTFHVSVYSGLSSGEIAGIVVGGGVVSLVAAAVGVICYRKKRQVL